MSICGGCQHGHHQEQGYWKIGIKKQGAIQEKVYYWLGKGVEIIAIFCWNYIGYVNKKPTKKSNSKGKNTVKYKLGKIIRG